MHQGIEETAPDMWVATTILTAQMGQLKRVGPLPEAAVPTPYRNKMQCYKIPS
jgi:hypothetical protein